MVPKVTGQLNTTNYLSTNSNETINLASASVSAWEGGTISFGAGSDINYSYSGGKTTIKPVAELKVKQNIGKYLSAQFRLREFGDAEQYRVTFGGNYDFDEKNWSICGAVHVTAKDNGQWSYNTGGWISATYKTKNGVSISTELQQNIPLGNGADPINALKSFNDGNKMINVSVSIPFG